MTISGRKRAFDKLEEDKDKENDSGLEKKESDKKSDQKESESYKKYLEAAKDRNLSRRIMKRYCPEYDEVLKLTEKWL
jgi:hypothetical protein